MNKISIVQRRRDRNKQVTTSAAMRARQLEKIKEESGSEGCHDEEEVLELQSQKRAAEIKENDSSRFDIALNMENLPEMNSLLHLSEIMQSGEEEATLKVNRDENNNVIFQFNIKQHLPFKTLTSEDVCELLKISRSTLYKNVHEKTIPCFRIGNQIRFLETDVMDYVKKCMVRK